MSKKVNQFNEQWGKFHMLSSLHLSTSALMRRGGRRRQKEVWCFSSFFLSPSVAYSALFPRWVCLLTHSLLCFCHTTGNVLHWIPACESQCCTLITAYTWERIKQDHTCQENTANTNCTSLNFTLNNTGDQFKRYWTYRCISMEKIIIKNFIFVSHWQIWLGVSFSTLSLSCLLNGKFTCV